MIRRNPVSTRGASCDSDRPSNCEVPLSSNSKRPTQRRGNSFGAFVVVSFLLFWRLLAATFSFAPVSDEEATAVQLPSTKLQNASDYHTFSFRPTGKIESNVSIISRTQATCRNNAIVLLAQKRHATYDRDSYGLLVKALKLISKNYIARQDHAENLDVFLFHTGEFDWRDVEYLEPLISDRKGILKLVNLDETVYWTLPPWHLKDNQTHWKGSDIFPVGYR
jgi:hypothetical protein